MKFFDYAREWVIKNIPEKEHNREIVLILCNILVNQPVSFPRAIEIAHSFYRLLVDYHRSPNFYERSYQKYE